MRKGAMHGRERGARGRKRFPRAWETGRAGGKRVAHRGEEARRRKRRRVREKGHPCCSPIERERGEKERRGGKRKWQLEHLSRSRPFRSADSRLLLRLHGLHRFVFPTSTPSASVILLLTSTSSSPILYSVLHSTSFLYSSSPFLPLFRSLNYIAYACLDLGLGYALLMWYAACAWMGINCSG